MALRAVTGPPYKISPIRRANMLELQLVERARPNSSNVNGVYDAGELAHDDIELITALRALLDYATMGLPSQHPARAQTSVELSVKDCQGGSLPWALIHLDREPISVAPGGGQAEVGLCFSREDLRKFLTGDLQLPMAIARGDVAFSGPVRKFLRIAPVLRALARSDASRTHAEELK